MKAPKSAIGETLAGLRANRNVMSLPGFAQALDEMEASAGLTDEEQRAQQILGAFARVLQAGAALLDQRSALLAHGASEQPLQGGDHVIASVVAAALTEQAGGLRMLAQGLSEGVLGLVNEGLAKVRFGSESLRAFSPDAQAGAPKPSDWLGDEDT